MPPQLCPTGLRAGSVSGVQNFSVHYAHQLGIAEYITHSVCVRDLHMYAAGCITKLTLIIWSSLMHAVWSPADLL